MVLQVVKLISVKIYEITSLKYMKLLFAIYVICYVSVIPSAFACGATNNIFRIPLVNISALVFVDFVMVICWTPYK